MIHGQLLYRRATVAALLIIAIFGAAAACGGARWAYPVTREAARLKIHWETRRLATLETDHFIIKYTAADQPWAPVIAAAAEDAYHRVGRFMGYTPGGKSLIVIYREDTGIFAPGGQLANQEASGIYWGGVIQVLSPAGTDDRVTAEQFARSGPLLHEYTHLALDYLTSGNYPRWFTEGLAQYYEYKAYGLEWITAANSFSGPLYTMTELTENFDRLPNQALAYRQSLAAVRYIAEAHGEDSLNKVIARLQAGDSMEQALSGGISLTAAEFAAAWPLWAFRRMERPV